MKRVSFVNDGIGGFITNPLLRQTTDDLEDSTRGIGSKRGRRRTSATLVVRSRVYVTMAVFLSGWVALFAKRNYVSWMKQSVVESNQAAKRVLIIVSPPLTGRQTIAEYVQEQATNDIRYMVCCSLGNQTWSALSPQDNVTTIVHVQKLFPGFWSSLDLFRKEQGNVLTTMLIVRDPVAHAISYFNHYILSSIPEQRARGLHPANMTQQTAEQWLQEVIPQVTNQQTKFLRRFDVNDVLPFFNHIASTEHLSTILGWYLRADPLPVPPLLHQDPPQYDFGHLGSVHVSMIDFGLMDPLSVETVNPTLLDAIHRASRDDGRLYESIQTVKRTQGLLPIHSAIRAESALADRLSSFHTLNQDKIAIRVVNDSSLIPDLIPGSITGPPNKKEFAEFFRSSPRAIIVFLHIPKTGGSTLREYFQTQVHNATEQYIGLHSIPLWKTTSQQVTDYLHASGPDAADGPLFLEDHVYPPVTTTLLPKIHYWRALAKRRRVPFFAFTVVREPISLCLSYFNFFFVQQPNLHHQNTPGFPRQGTEEEFRQQFIVNPQVGMLTNTQGARCKNLTHVGIARKAIVALIAAMDWIGTLDTLNEEILPLVAYLAKMNYTMSRSQKTRVQIVNSVIAPALTVGSISAELKEFIAERTRLDRELYDTVRATYNFSEWRQFLQEHNVL
jgi:Sulfotransferase family